jgi:hypothetical protein
MTDEDPADRALDVEVTVEAGARMLGESVPYLLELLDAGAIRFRTVDEARVVVAADVEAVRQRRARAADALAEMARIVEQSPGGWDH